MPRKRGTIELKVKYRGLPVIRRAAGTSDPKTVAALRTMLDALHATGRLDVLEAIARGRLTPLEVFSRWRQGQELVLPPADVFPQLAGAWARWCAAIDGDAHRRSAKITGKALRFAERATLADLPKVLAAYRPRAAAHPRSFNLARAHVQAFLRDTVGKSHALYAQVQDIRPYPQRRGGRAKGQPRTVAEVREVCAKMGAVAGPMAWTMAVTGMGPKEYWEDGFDVSAGDRVQVRGRKRAGRMRAVPHWSVVVAPRLGLKAFRARLRAAAPDWVTYDLRRSFARWCEEAGIIRTNLAAYLGHGSKTVTDLYTFGELAGQLERDAAKLRAYAGEAPAWLQIVAGGRT